MTRRNPGEWDDKKIQILKVAQKIFARYGFFKSTMDDIAQAMGMKKGSLYYYYKSKEDIFRDVVRYESDRFLEELHKELTCIAPLKEKILHFFRFRVRYFQRVMNLHQLSIQAVLEVSPLIPRLYQDCIEKEKAVLQFLLDEGVRAGVFQACDTARIARSLITVAEAVKFREFHRSDAISAVDVDFSIIEDEIVFIISLILRGLMASPQSETAQEDDR